MKKFLIASGVAVLALATVVSAQGYVFNSNLTVGSTGADVSALQTLLIAQGYNIPAVASGAAAKGYFGSQTKTAVMAYQAASGVPATGFVGPLTRGKLNGAPAAVSVAAGCPVGFNCTPIGQTTTPVQGTVSGLTAGTDGSISVSDSSFVSSGQSLKKGDTKNVVAVKLQATAGPVQVTRLDVHFSVRPWLFFSQAQLVDSSGKILATKPISSINDVTEITSGSDYLVRFEGLNFVVTPGVNPDLAVGVTVLPATDKITNGMPVYAGIPTNAIRTINGIGISDSVGGDAAFSSANGSSAGDRSFTLSSSGSVADISTRVSPLAPASQVSQAVSATVTTSNVPLGIFSLKSANNSATLQAVNFTVQTDPAFSETGLFSNLRIMIGSQTYGALSFVDGGTATFTNLSISLPQDQWVDLTLVADVSATSTDVKASSTLDSSTINAIDSTYTQATVGGLAYTSGNIDQNSANTLLTINSVSVSGATASAGAAVTTGTSNAPVRYPLTYTFTLVNNSNNSLYIASDVSTVLGTTSSPTNASSTITAFFPTPTPLSNDATGAYVIPSGGGSRTFTVIGTMQKSSNTSTSESLTISRIKYSTSVANAIAGTGTNITTGLEKLSVLTAF